MRCITHGDATYTLTSERKQARKGLLPESISTTIYKQAYTASMGVVHQDGCVFRPLAEEKAA
jgi:predicted amidohydrolase